MAKKKFQSNRFEDSVKDYVRTNSAYTDDNKKRAQEAGMDKGWRAPLNLSEKVMIAVGILAAVGCIIKYAIL